MQTRVAIPFLVVTATFAAAAPHNGFLRDLKPAAPAKRIVSLAPSVTEMIFALGAGSRVVGVTRYCDRPAEAKLLAKIGGFSDPSLEAVLALRPDLVVTVPAEANRRVADRLVDLKVPVLVVPDTTLADVFSALKWIGDSVDASAQASALQKQIEGDLKAIGDVVKNRPAPRVLVVYDHRPLVVGGPGAFADEVLRLAGGVNVVEQGGVPYPTLSIETVLALAPDIILDASMGANDPKAREQAAHAFDRFPSIPAVKHKRVRILPSGTLMRPGPAIADDVRLVAALLHPDAFPSTK